MGADASAAEARSFDGGARDAAGHPAKHQARRPPLAGRQRPGCVRRGHPWPMDSVPERPSELAGCSPGAFPGTLRDGVVDAVLRVVGIPLT